MSLAGPTRGAVRQSPAALRFHRADGADIAALRALADQIWRTSYAAMLSAEQIDYMLARMYAPETIEAEIVSGTIWEMVEVDGRLIGYLAMTCAEGANADLHKLYVLPGHQGSGIGQGMLARADRIARCKGCTRVRLRVNRTNGRAIRSYTRAGYRQIGTNTAEIGGGFVMDDYIFEKTLPSELLIKICGLSTPRTVDVALQAGADWIGFVMFPKSPRDVPLDRAVALAERVRGRGETVILTVNADDRTLDALVEGVRPSRLQLHGGETPERVAAVRSRYELPVVKAIGVSERVDVAAGERYRGSAETVLFDAKPPKASRLPGGNGLSFDWAFLSDAPSPFMLSGGLTPSNVSDAIRASGAAGVDVSSGVELSPGVKDDALIRAFIAAVRG